VRSKAARRSASIPEGTPLTYVEIDGAPHGLRTHGAEVNEALLAFLST
jgi:peroxiredoxin